MFKYILAFVLLTPLIGVYLMEQGAFGLDVGVVGYENGAFLHFLLYVVLVFSSFYFFRKVNILKIRKYPESNASLGYSSYIIFLFANTLFLFIMLFGFGGINVLLGKVGKGTFRMDFGYFGALAYFIIKYFSPVLLACLAFDYRLVKNDSVKTLFFSLNIIVVILIGFCWGFKSTSIVMLIPLAIVYFWNIKFYIVIFLFIFSVAFFVGTAVFFDEKSIAGFTFVMEDYTTDNALNAIFYRMTVQQGNTPWYVWELYSTGVELPPYAPTLLAAFGDKFLSLFGGIDLNNINLFAKYHFDVLLTSLVSDSYEARLTGHNVTGTAFADGVFIGGKYGVLFISIFAGFITGQCYNIISRSITNSSPVIGSLAAVYFFSSVFSWLNGGGVTLLFHISTIIGLIITWLFLKFIRGLVTPGKQIQKENI